MEEIIGIIEVTTEIEVVIEMEDTEGIITEIMIEEIAIETMIEEIDTEIMIEEIITETMKEEIDTEEGQIAMKIEAVQKTERGTEIIEDHLTVTPLRIK